MKRSTDINNVHATERVDAEPLAGSGFEHEQPEGDFSSSSEQSEQPEQEDEQ